MTKALIPLLLAILALPAHARTWRNKAGTRSFEADYISNDGKQVTLRRKKGILTYTIEKLHTDDQTWLKKNHPIDPKSGGIDDPDPPEGSAFDTLEFGDDQDEVIKKLRKSRLVDGDVVEALIARTGMNGIYRTQKTIGGLHCHLYFEWTRGKSLRELSLRTKPLPSSSYDSELKANWTEWIELLSMLHGKPVQDGDYPEQEDLEDGLVLGSHLWYTEEGHSVILGTGQDGKKFSAVVRITSEHIRPVRIQ